MKFKEKASSLVLAMVMLASSVMPVAAARNDAIIGSDRYDTAGKIADKMGYYDKAILVNGDSIADGLSASSLAGKENAPILLVKKDSIPKQTLRRLYNVKKVYIIGREGAISSRVENSLNQSGMKTERIGGYDRVDTSLEVAKKVGNYNKAFLVNGYKGQADAMSAASVAARDKAPIILTNGKDIPTYTRSGVQYYVVGGETVVNNYVKNRFNAIRLSGSDRYKTNKVVVEKFYPNSSRYYFAKGDELIDALAVSSLAKNNGVVLVSKGSDKSVMSNVDKVQVGGMKEEIVNSVFNSKPNPNPDPDEKPNPNPDGNKPDEKPNPKPDEKPEPGPAPTPKPDEKTYNINSPEFQSIVRKEFYRLLDAHRAKNNVPATVHHWACEESSMIKSKDMIEKGYFGHYDTITTPHLSGYFENIAGQWVSNAVTEQEGKALANRLFNQWKNSPGHNKIMLDNSTWGSYYSIDGFSFYAKKSSYDESFGGHLRRTGGQVYMIKATYHISDTSEIIK